jgi:hypothetical protein
MSTIAKQDRLRALRERATPKDMRTTIRGLARMAAEEPQHRSGVASEIRLIERAIRAYGVSARRAQPSRNGRAPRRARSGAPRPAAARVDSDDGPPGPPPTLVNQRTAAALLGWTASHFLDFVKRKGIPCSVDRRVHNCRLDDVLAALGLPSPRQPVQAPESRVNASERIRLRLIGGKDGAR